MYTDIEFRLLYLRINYRIQYAWDPSQISDRSGHKGQEMMLTNTSHEAIYFKGLFCISELHIIDTERYKRVAKAEQQRLGKVSAKSIELHCTVVVKEYGVQCNIY